MARLTKEDWLKKGLSVLSLKGYNSLRLEYLCDQLKVTRGSFYHHFEDIPDYVDKLMEYWEDSSNEIMDGVALSGGSPLEKLNELQNRVFDISARLEVVIRAWATFNKTVLKYVRRIDKKRVAFIAELYLEEGYPAKSADATARIEYAAYVGIQNLHFTEAKKEETAGLFRILEHVLIRYGKENIGLD